MIKKTSIWALLFISLYILSNVSVANEAGSHGGDYHHDAHDHSRILVKLVGWSTARSPNENEEWLNLADDAVCHDVEMVDLHSNKVIGISTDCFSDIEPDSGGGAGFTGTTFLNFPDGTIVAQGNFTAQPVLRETTTIDGVPITTVTGAAREGNSFIGEWGRFENSSGNVRVSGMVNTTEYAFMPGDPLYFDCIFEIQLFGKEENGSDSSS
jgi:hypothetical protein